LCFDGWARSAIKTGNPRPFQGTLSDQIGTISPYVPDCRAIVAGCGAHVSAGVKMTILPRTGRISISLTIATTFVGLVVVLLGSVLTVSYFSNLRNTLDLVGEIVVQSSGFGD
jgi:hypothetical protein